MFDLLEAEFKPILNTVMVEHVDPALDGIVGEVLGVDHNYTQFEILWSEPINGQFVTRELIVDVRVI